MTPSDLSTFVLKYTRNSTFVGFFTVDIESIKLAAFIELIRSASEQISKLAKNLYPLVVVYFPSAASTVSQFFVERSNQ